MPLTLDQLKSHLGDAAVILRGVSYDHKCYRVTTLMAYKRWCDRWEHEAIRGVEHKVIIPEAARWINVIQSKVPRTGALINAIQAIYEANIDLQGKFPCWRDGINSGFVPNDISDEKVNELINHFGKIDFSEENLPPEIWGGGCVFAMVLDKGLRQEPSVE